MEHKTTSDCNINMKKLEAEAAMFDKVLERVSKNTKEHDKQYAEICAYKALLKNWFEWGNDFIDQMHKSPLVNSNEFKSAMIAIEKSQQKMLKMMEDLGIHHEPNS